MTEEIPQQSRADCTTITIEYPDGRAERLELEPRSDGNVDVVESVLTEGGYFREIGHDVAERVNVKTPE
jgi:hypothetical protein